jgi:hypothetical protein
MAAPEEKYSQIRTPEGLDVGKISPKAGTQEGRLFHCRN